MCHWLYVGHVGTYIVAIGSDRVDNDASSNPYNSLCQHCPVSAARILVTRNSCRGAIADGQAGLVTQTDVSIWDVEALCSHFSALVKDRPLPTSTKWP